MIATGGTVGLALALAVGALLRTSVYQASTNDALTLGAAAAIVVLLATRACWVPARWALRVEPARVLAAD